MNIRRFLLALLFLCPLLVARAEFSVEAVVNMAKADVKNAPAIVAKAAVENPGSVFELVAAAVAALPEQAVEIVRAVFAVLPKRALDIVRAAIQGAPRLAPEITAVAVDTFPDQAPEIVATAVDAAPDDLKGAIAAPTGNTGVAGTNPAFPAQPIRPDLVSPSS